MARAGQKETEWDILVAEKQRLWNEVKALPDFVQSEQYRRIEEIDADLWRIKNSTKN
ncbi:hypothetical protein [Paenibacillus chitinolyticus]|uniref:Uncharacterized protein n=1 Tax=Paenibacillus chitinolyticus TaxID=79263 RepID=A0ABT4FMF6_9BACL|nr:hypothetical protein [Paenibacillus chitinolyticus]MCY9593722.1 hypothetical protein [Paenibacillus chitinolyticus]MCY9599712.1 hypothetical protein [Paenibacillus chitinolyticus]